MVFDQIIATSHDQFSPNSGLVREILLFQGNLGWCFFERLYRGLYCYIEIIINHDSTYVSLINNQYSGKKEGFLMAHLP